jgi:predicted exporter
VRLLSILAVIAVAALLFLEFWSGTFLLLVMIPLAIGSLVAVASVVLVFGAIHGITLAFGVTLTGVAVDYPIHLVSQFNGSPAQARQHVRQIWPTIRLGVITTLIAYASLIFSDFTGLTQLGLFTVTGLLTAAAVTRWWLPLMVPKGAVFRPGMRRPHSLLERLGRRAPRARTWAALSIIVAAAFLILVDQPIREYNIDSLSPIPPQRRLDDRQLRSDLGMWSGGKLLAVVAPNAELALRKSEQIGQQLDQLKAAGALRDFEFAARYLPSQRTQRQRQLRLPAVETLRARFNLAIDGLPFKREVFEPFFSDIGQTRTQSPLTVDILQQTTVGSLLATMLFQLEDQWIATILLHDVRDPIRLQQLSGRDGETETIYMDLKSMSNAVMVRATDRILRLLGWGGLFIYLVLTINFRDVRKPLYILIPTIAAVLVVTALLVASGVKLTVFHMVALLLVIGLGLDYALFFNRLTHSEQEWATTFKALWVCCVTTVLVFGMLMLSHTPPLQAVGLTVAMGAALCLVFGAIWSTATPRRRKRKKKWRNKRQPAPS